MPRACHASTHPYQTQLDLTWLSLVWPPFSLPGLGLCSRLQCAHGLSGIWDSGPAQQDVVTSPLTSSGKKRTLGWWSASTPVCFTAREKCMQITFRRRGNIHSGISLVFIVNGFFTWGFETPGGSQALILPFCVFLFLRILITQTLTHVLSSEPHRPFCMLFLVLTPSWLLRYFTNLTYVLV